MSVIQKKLKQDNYITKQFYGTTNATNKVNFFSIFLYCSRSVHGYLRKMNLHRKFTICDAKFNNSFTADLSNVLPAIDYLFGDLKANVLGVASSLKSAAQILAIKNATNILSELQGTVENILSTFQIAANNFHSIVGDLETMDSENNDSDDVSELIPA